MKREDLSDALEHLDLKMIAEAEAVRQDRAEKEPEEIPDKPAEDPTGSAPEKTRKEVPEEAAKPLRRPWRKWGLVAACLCLLLVGVWLLPSSPDQAGEAGQADGQGLAEGGAQPEAAEGAGEAKPEGNGAAREEEAAEAAGGAASPYALVTAAYPQMAARPVEADYQDAETGAFDSEAYMAAWEAWQKSLQAQQEQAEGDVEGLESFFARSTRQFLGGSAEENRVYSPLNLYMALAMLAETTEGQSRQQVLDLLGTDSLESLREQAAALWNGSYCDDGVTTSVLANSLWLNQSIPYNQTTMEALAEHYYASSFQGEMGSEAYNQALRDWINQQTGGLLEEQAGGLSMSPDTLLALASSVYFKAGWSQAISQTEADVFYGPDAELTCDFMRQSDQQSLYWGDQFTAVSKAFVEGGGRMWFLLPDSGVSPEELLEDSQAMAFLLSGGDWENQEYRTVNLSVPKFDIASQTDLIPGLQALGVQDVFDSARSDFSPVSDAPEMERAAVTQAQQAARVTIDEEGCEAAAYTAMMVEEVSALEPGEEVNFILNRPFLFAITGEDGLPLFVGIVNHPA